MRYVIDKPFGERFLGIEFEVTDPRVPDACIRDQLQLFANAIDNGVVFEEGAGDLRMGWVALRLVATDKGYLQIQEPDFVHVPFRWANRLDNTLMCFRRQAEMAARLGLESEFTPPLFESSCIVCDRYRHANTWEAERFAPEGDLDSGWYFGCTDSTHDHNDPRQLSRLSLYEATVARPEWMDYLSLPVGIRLASESKGLLTAWLRDAKLTLST